MYGDTKASHPGPRVTALPPSLHLSSKLTQDNRIESPIPILPLPTPDTETEKLIKMKDEEVSTICARASWMLELESQEFLQGCPLEVVLKLPTPVSPCGLLGWRTGLKAVASSARETQLPCTPDMVPLCSGRSEHPLRDPLASSKGCQVWTLFPF